MLFQCYEGEEHMLLRVTERIAFFLYDKKIIQKEDIRWCVYLFQKWILNTVSNGLQGATNDIKKQVV